MSFNPKVFRPGVYRPGVYTPGALLDPGGVAAPSAVMRGSYFFLDAANPESYPGTGSTWFDVSLDGLSHDFTIGAGLTYEATPVPCFEWAAASQFAGRAYESINRLGSPSDQGGAETVEASWHALIEVPDWDDGAAKTIYAKRASGGYQGLLSATNLAVQAYVEGAYRSALLARSGIAAGWHLVSGTWDGRYLRGYLDGVEFDVYDHGDEGNPIVNGSNYGYIIGADSNGATAASATAPTLGTGSKMSFHSAHYVCHTPSEVAAQWAWASQRLL